MSSAMLPEVDFAGIKISRLLIGGNPFAGNAHTNSSLGQEMLDYYTVANIKKDLAECEKQGITCGQLRGDMHIRRLLKEYWDEGGQIKWLAQTAPEMGDFATHVTQVKNYGASAIYVHGGVADRLFRNGGLDELHECIKVMRDLGIPIGLGAHNPELIEEVDAQGWDLDFYATCLYNITRRPQESFIATGRVHEEEFLPEDPARMCQTIRQTNKPVVAFKALGAGRNCGSREDIRKALEFAYANIKPGDVVTVGVFTKHENQIAQNAGMVREILAQRV